MNSKLYFAWDGKVPNLQIICVPMPNTPNLPLTGTSFIRKPLDDFIEELNCNLKEQMDLYYSYVLDHYQSDEEADIYTLQTWQVCTSNDGTYEGIVLLYYAAINPYLTIKKHMGADLAEEYLQRIPAYTFD